MVTISRTGGNVVFTAADGRIDMRDINHFNVVESEVGIFRFQDSEGNVLTSFLPDPIAFADFAVSPSTGSTLANKRTDLKNLNPG